jgi:dihydropyrimidinase
MPGQSPDILITNGLVVAQGKITPADISIQGEKIAQLVPRPNTSTTNGLSYVVRHPSSTRVIDASGKYIFPGIIDAHVHPIYLDDKYDTSVSAAFGGVTTMIHYAYVKPKESLLANLQSFRDDGLKNSLLDFGIHMGLFDVEHQIQEVPAAFAMGVTSFKVFMTYAKLKWMTDDYWMTALMDVVGQNRGLVHIHCENGLATDYLEDKYNRAELDSKKMFTAMRPALLEAEATNRAISIAQVMGCAVYIVHNSAAENLDPLRRARQNGWRVIGETCPQYLALSDDTTQRLGSLAKIGPPLRTARDNDAMWQGLAEGTLTTIGSDHAPKEKTDNFFESQYGAPHIETMLPVCYDLAVNHAKLPLPQLIAAMSETPAKIFGLYPRKGALHVGSDADLVIFDPTKTWTISTANQHSKAGFTLYEGRTVTGAVELTMQRGRVIVASGELRATKNNSEFLKTDTSHLYNV